MAETVKLYQEVLRSVQDAIIEIKGGFVGEKEKVVFISLPTCEMQFRRIIRSYFELKAIVSDLIEENNVAISTFSLIYQEGSKVLSFNSQDDFEAAPMTIELSLVSLAE
ncbi:hypothetical protein D3C80_1585020 [compost metagenome]